MIKNIGIQRHIDKLGRIVIPIEWRKLLGVEIGEKLEISMNENRELIIKKIDP